jgi:hypothetical protein
MLDELNGPKALKIAFSTKYLKKSTDSMHERGVFFFRMP